MRYLTLLLATALACPAAAGVVSRDLFEPGDGLLTYDDVNQREWLDFSVMANLDPGVMLAKLDTDGRFSRFQLANLASVEGLVQSGFDLAHELEDYPIYVDPGSPYSPPSTSPHWLRLLGKIGDSFHQELPDVTWPYTGGLVAPLESADRPAAVLAPIDSGFDSTDYRLLPISFGTGESGSASGTVNTVNSSAFQAALMTYWLYREAAPIPEPTTACLTLAACLSALRYRGFA